ncbi:MAG TPA: CoA transferase [Dehalococcoidia bacterium]|nr:CoA transferase [Dehalococcoidia bacterium]
MREEGLVLSDLTVLELSEGIAGPYCGKLLAALGARVIKIEPPGGDRARLLAPFAGDEPHPEKSGLFLYLNMAKESIVLDLTRAPDRTQFRRLAAEADIIIEGFMPGTLAALELDFAALAGENPRMILCSITRFGQDGPYRDYLATEITAQALGGLLYTIGLPDREPLKIGGSPALCNAGGAAFSAIMAALWQRDRTGAGQAIDISLQEATAITQIHASIEATWQGTNLQRRPSVLLEAKDGWASVGLEMGVAAETWPRVCAMLGRPELAADPRFASSAARRENREAVAEIVADLVRGQPKEAIYHELQSLRSIAGYVATAADLHASAQLAARGFFQQIEHPVAGSARYPGLPFRIGEMPAVTGRAPLLGEHAQATTQRADKGMPAKPPSTPDALGPTPSTPPLEGVRILDLTQVAVGPYATLLLAGLGAEVIKVESNRRPDISRGPVHPEGETQLKQYPHGEPGERPWNRAAYFNQRNRGKLGITLDLSDERGKDLCKRLAACCDAVAENFRASVMERQGLGWDELRAVNPRLVYLKLSSQGDSGPERDYGSLGSTLEQTGGLVSVTGYRDGPPLMTNGTYPDPVAGVLAVGALIAGLRRARQTGEGQFVDFSQREATIGLFGEAMMDFALNGRVQGPIGNRHPQFAPQGVYPCSGNRGAGSSGRDARGASPGDGQPSGPDDWIAISIEDDGQWARLQQAMGNPAWTRGERLTTAAGRRALHDELDSAISAWTAGYDKHALMHLLQRHGVPAGAVLTGVQLLNDAQLKARGWWEELIPTEVGEPHRFVSAPWRLAAAPRRPSTPAPCLGEHNARVYRGLLGLSADEYADLQAAGVISIEPLWLRA